MLMDSEHTIKETADALGFCWNGGLLSCVQTLDGMTPAQ